MPRQPLRALIVEDSEDDAQLVLRELHRHGFDVTWERVWTEASMRASLADRPWDVVLSDFSMPSFDAPAALHALQATGLDLPFLVISGTIGEEAAVAAMRSGAHDYLMKGRLTRLGAAVERELRDAGIRRDHRRAIDKIEHLNRVLRAIRDINKLIVQEKDPIRLIERACEMLIATRGYANAVIVLTDDSRRPLAVAHRVAGDTGERASTSSLALTGLTACMEQCLTSSHPVVVEGETPSCGDCPLHPYHSGLQRMVSGLVHGDRSHGVIGIAMPPGLVVDAEEQGLFEEIAGDIGFALYSDELEGTRQRGGVNKQLTNRILRHLNRSLDGEDAIDTILSLIQDYGDFEAVGIRLQEGDDFPYFVVEGFEGAFVEKERYLCARDAGGKILRDPAGKAVIDCMCGNVIRGRTDTEMPFFSRGGSFWSNGTSELLATTTEDQRLARTRNRCNAEGYESVALIPLRTGEESIGLLQISDHRKDRFTLEMIEFLEDIGVSVGIALARNRADAETRSVAKFPSESPDPVLRVDRDGSLLYVNEAGLGCLSDWHLKPRAAVPPVLMDVIQRTLDEGATRTVDLDHGERTYSFCIAPSADAGYANLYGTDITDRKRLQAQVAQSDRLASMGMLAAGVAHEINNPLAYVLYNLESLTEDLPQLSEALRGRFEDTGAGPLAPAMLEDLLARAREALEGTQRIKDVARGLGTFTRVEQTRRVSVHLRHVIEVAINMVFNEIKYRARLVKDYGKTATVLASDGGLSQVFLNLLINAAHAIEEGDVDGNEIRVRTWQDGDEVCAEVRDTGQGISAELLPHLFEPFFTTKDVGVGTGLGLAISKSIVDGFGGRLDVTSQPGKGASFVVRLPAEHAAHAADVPLDGSRTRAGTGGRILVIDDEPAIRKAMARMLRGHDVVLAASGEEARELLETDQAFDLILCDLMMPVMSGVELHQWLSTAHPALAEQVVFVTGGAFTPTASKYLSSVDNLRLEKPFDVPSIKKMIEERVAAARSNE